ncbi:MAG: hemerythrin domain-containing protein [Sphingorhabdus sp.]
MAQTQSPKGHGSHWYDRANTNTGRAVGAALAGVAIGVATTLGRKMAVQTAAAGTGSWDDMLKHEHRAVEKIFDRLEATTADQSFRRATLTTKLKHALTKHAVQEENIIYPILVPSEAAGERGDVYEDHADIKKMVHMLEHMENSDSDFLAKVATLRKIVEEHVKEEEENLFPQIKRARSKKQNEQLTHEVWREGLKLA